MCYERDTQLNNENEQEKEGKKKLATIDANELREEEERAFERV